MRFFSFIFFLLLTIINTNAETVVRVAVAANLTHPIKEIKKQFEKENPKIKLQISLGSSGKLTAQVINGAEFDLFLSANESYPLKLNRLGLVRETPRPYCLGGLMLFSAGHIDVSKGIKSLNTSKLKHLAIANPKLAPYGEAAEEVLKSEKMYQKVKGLMVVGANVTQSVQYALTAAEAAFIPLSALYTPALKEYKTRKDCFYEIPEEMHEPIIQGAALLSSGKSPAGAKKFLDYILSEKGQKILESFGYRPASCKCAKKLTCPKCIKL